MIFDLLAETLDMHIHGTGITDIFIAPDVIQELFPCKNLIGRSCQEIEKLQFLWRHVNGRSFINNRIVGLIYDQIRIFHNLAGIL